MVGKCIVHMHNTAELKAYRLAYLLILVIVHLHWIYM